MRVCFYYSKAFNFEIVRDEPVVKPIDIEQLAGTIFLKKTEAKYKGKMVTNKLLGILFSSTNFTCYITTAMFERAASFDLYF